MSNILQNVAFGAVPDGTGVTLIIGNAKIGMSYDDAFKLSQWLRVAAKEAKRNNGDIKQHWSVLGTLTARESDEGVSHAGHTGT